MKKFTEQQLSEIHVMLTDKSIPYSQIKESFGLSEYDLKKLVRQFGIVRRPASLGKTSNRKPGPLKTLSQLEAKLAAERKRVEEAMAEIERLQSLKEQFSIWFEHDRHNLTVHGIGPVGFTALVEDWIRFLNNEGPRKLREYVSGVKSKS